MNQAALLQELLAEFKALNARLKRPSASTANELQATWLTEAETLIALSLTPLELHALRITGALAFSQILGKRYYKATDLHNLLTASYSRSIPQSDETE